MELTKASTFFLRWTAAAVLATTALAAAATAPVSDDFNTGTLNTSLWSFINPVGDGSVALNGSEAVLSVPAGKAHDLWTAGNATARILQPIGNIDFAVEVKFDSVPQTSIQDEGIIVAADANNYLRFDMYYSGGVYLFASSFVNNKPTTYANPKLGSSLAAPVWLRIQRQGNTWTGSWSTDGLNFAIAVNFNYALAAAWVGPYVGNNGSPIPAFAAKIDYFHNLTNSGGSNTPDLTLTKTHSGNFIPGGTSAYTLTASNIGTAASSGSITVADTLPIGLVATGASGSGWTCTGSSQSQSCVSSASIPPGATAPPITVTVAVSSSAAGVITNTATVSGGGDANSSNNTASDPTTIGTISTQGPVSDDFFSTALNPRWTFVNPVGNGSVKLDGSHAVISVPAGSAHDVWSTGNNGARLLQNVTNTNFDVTVKLDSAVDHGCQTQGMIIQQDTKNFVRLDNYNNGTNVYAFAATFVNGAPTTRLNKVISVLSSVPLYLRVQRSGDLFVYLMSTDGRTYTELTRFTYRLVVNQMGPYAGNSTCGFTPPAFSAKVDYFFNNASPIVPEDGDPTGNPEITAWYGDSQTFGRLGIPQPWVNILGNILSPNGPITSASFSVNGGPAQRLSIGPNTWRLVDEGDFNVEIPYTSLQPGANLVDITAVDGLGKRTTRTVTVNYVAGAKWPTSYSISNWSNASSIQDLVQIIDGKWEVQPDGSVRTMQYGYDRLLTLGEMSWRNYVVTADLTFHYVRDYHVSPPSGRDRNTGSGILVGWKGHTSTPQPPGYTGPPAQPTFGHYFPAIGWYTSEGGNGLVLEIYRNTVAHPEKMVVFQPSAQPALRFETKYTFKMQVQQHGTSSASRYYFKVWPSSTAEPANWTLQFDGELSEGSIVLGFHRSDVSIGAVTVNPLSALPN